MQYAVLDHPVENRREPVRSRRSMPSRVSREPQSNRCQHVITWPIRRHRCFACEQTSCYYIIFVRPKSLLLSDGRVCNRFIPAAAAAESISKRSNFTDEWYWKRAETSEETSKCVPNMFTIYFENMIRVRYALIYILIQINIFTEQLIKVQTYVHTDTPIVRIFNTCFTSVP